MQATESTPSTASASPQPMTNVDRAWLRMDEPNNLMVINGVFLFGEPMELETLRTLLRERLVPVARFGQRLDRHENRTCWTPVEVDIEHHVQALELEAPGDEEALKRAVGRLMAEPLELDKPLWRFYLVEDLAGAGAALVSRVHHCMGDGIAMMMVLLSLTELEPGVEIDSDTMNALHAIFTGGGAGNGDLDAAREHAAKLLPAGVKLMERISEVTIPNSKRVIGNTVSLGHLTVLPPDPRTPFKGPLSQSKRATWSDRLDLESVMAVKRKLDVTVNDVLVAAMAGGLRRYMLHRGETPKQKLNVRAVVPVSLRTLQRLGELGNQFGLVFLSLPIGLAEPEQRLAAVAERMNGLKRSFQAEVAYRVLITMGLLPQPAQRLVERIFGTKATTVLTNVPGPTNLLYLGGNPIRDMMFWVPQSGRVSMGLSIISYNGGVRVGVTTDAGLVDDPEEIIAAFEDEVSLFAARAGVDL